jgi:ribose 5-phosphate isomerase A
MSTDEREAEKAAAARAAVEDIADGMLVGLGSGSTAAHVVAELGRRVAQGLRVTCVATSTATERLARTHALRVRPFDDVARVDLTIDGADEIDPSFRAIKGGGGALLREKVVAAASDVVTIVVDGRKVVPQLGRFPLPLEVVPFARAWVDHAVAALGGTPSLRMAPGGAAFRTDQGNVIVDVAFGGIADPGALSAALSGLPGVVEHGLFLDEIDVVIVGAGGGATVERRVRMPPPGGVV